MSHFALRLNKVSKSFNRRMIFSDISFILRTGESLTITGRNGSGKSTLLKIIAGILTPSQGRVEIDSEGSTIPASTHYSMLGFVSPYLQLYDEFTALENLEIIQQIRGVRPSRDELRALLDRVGLNRRGDDLLRTYSSGMKQRMKYAAAIAHHPSILLLDEPTSNLDSEGKAIVREIVKEQQQRGIVIAATNETEEINLCKQLLPLGTEALQPMGNRS
ncbi:MAG: ABC transporter ATP-binding protein [Ignavibacteriae bacterium]|nr:ABC transporter ATP-binding protein [Ignavibacteriota bacterium]